MEEHTPEPEATNKNLKKQFTTVTTFSKYLALLLLIGLPFAGGWIGYTYAPVKVIEVENNVVPQDDASEANQEEFPAWHEQNTVTGSKLVWRHVTEGVAIDIGSYSDKYLRFDIGAQRSARDESLYIDILKFDEDSGDILLDYGEGYVPNKLISLHKMSEIRDLESYIKNIILKERFRGSEQEADTYISYELTNFSPKDDFDDFGFRKLCKLISDTSIIKNSQSVVTRYYLEVIDEKYAGAFMSSPCGSSVFIMIDDVLIHPVTVGGTDATAAIVDKDTVNLVDKKYY